MTLGHIRYGPVAMAVVADIAGDQKGEMLSWFATVGIVGTLLGAPVGGFLLSFLGGGEQTSTTFMVIFAIVAVTGVMAFVLGAIILPKEEQQVASHSGGSKFASFLSGIREVGSDKRVLVTSSMESARHLALGVLEAFLPIYAVAVVGLSPFHAGLLYAVQIVAAIVAKPVMGRYSDRYGRKYFIVVGLICCSLPMVCIPWLTSFSYLLIACLIFGLGEAVARRVKMTHLNV